MWTTRRKKPGEKPPEGKKAKNPFFTADISKTPGNAVARAVLSWLPKAPPGRGGVPVDKEEEREHFRTTYKHLPSIGQIT